MESTPRITRSDALIVALVTIVGAALRFYRLGGRSLWYDEAVIYHIVQGSFREILTNNVLENSAPPLYALLLGLLTGPDATEAMLRSLSAIASVTTIPLCYLLARQFVSSRAALLAPVLIAAAPTQLIYAQQLREYSMTVAIASGLIIVYMRFIRSPDTRNAIFLSAVAVVGLATQYGLSLMLAALNLVLLVTFFVEKRPVADYGTWGLTQIPAAVVAVILYLTVLRYQRPAVDAITVAGYLSANYWNGTANGLIDLVAAKGNNIIGYAFPGILMMILVAAGVIASVTGASAAMATAIFLVPTALVYLTALLGVYPYGAIRQDIFLTPMIYAIAAVGLDKLLAFVPRNWPALVKPVSAALVAIILIIPALGTTMRYLNNPVGYQPMRLIAGELTAKLRRDDKIYVYCGAIPAFGYYWRNHSETWIAGTLHLSWSDSLEGNRQMRAVQAELGELASTGQRTWVVLSHLDNGDRDELLAYLRRSTNMQPTLNASTSMLLLLNDRPDDMFGPRGRQPFSNPRR